MFASLRLHEELGPAERHVILVPPAVFEAGAEIDHPSTGRPMAHRGMRALGDAPRRDTEAPQDEPAEKRAPAAHAAVHCNVLIVVQCRVVQLHVLRSIRNFRFDGSDVAPAIVGI